MLPLPIYEHLKSLNIVAQFNFKCVELPPDVTYSLVYREIGRQSLAEKHNAIQGPHTEGHS